MLVWLLASLHLLGLGIGLGAVWVRGRALSHAPDPQAVGRALRADSWWGIAALLWLGTGLPRLLLGTEKPPGYYVARIRQVQTGVVIAIVFAATALARGL